jgi:hypothetical protein
LLQEEVAKTIAEGIAKNPTKAKRAAGRLKATAKSIRKKGLKSILPTWMKSDDENVQQQSLAGNAIDNIVATALEAIAVALEKGDDIAGIIAKAVSDLKKAGVKEDDGKIYNWFLQQTNNAADPQQVAQNVQEKVLDRFRKKLAGLTDKEKEDVIRRSFKELVENGALDYDDFKKIVADVLGFGALSEQEKKQMIEYVEQMNAVDDLAETARTQRTPESLKAYEDGAKKAEKAATALHAMLYNKPRIWDRLLSIMTLNTLGAVSFIQNVTYNIAYQATVRFPRSLLLAGLDNIIFGVSKMINVASGGKIPVAAKDFYATTAITKAQAEYFSKAIDGVVLAGEQFVSGVKSLDYMQKDVYSAQIKPWESVKELWANIKGERKLTTRQKVDKFIQAFPTMGMTAEIAARLLNLGDKWHRFGAEGAAAAQEAKQLKVPQKDIELFMQFPLEEATRIYQERGLSEQDAQAKAAVVHRRIVAAGEEATFQGKNIVDELFALAEGHFNAMAEDGGVKGALAMLPKTAIRLVMPFRKIPLNAAWGYFTLVNPQIALIQSAIHAGMAINKMKRGDATARLDFVDAKKWLAHAGMGVAAMAAYNWLVQMGAIIAGDDEDESVKEGKGRQAYVPKHKINISKVNRSLSGDNTASENGDVLVDLKWFGIGGSVMNTLAIVESRKKDAQRKKELDMFNEWYERLGVSAMISMEQGAFSGWFQWIRAYQEGGNFAHQFGLQLVNMGSNVVQPATLAQISRNQIPYEYGTNADTFLEKVKNTLASRSSKLRTLTDRQPPARIGLWGDTVQRGTGWSAVASRMFGITTLNRDAFAFKIYEDYERTGDAAFFPPEVKNEINKYYVDENGIAVEKPEKEKLDVSLAAELQQLVGKARKNLVAPFITGYATVIDDEGNEKKYSELNDDEARIRVLSKLYEAGLKQGQAEFYAKHPEFFVKK